jgi:uncharacterized membrane protein YidH (DUF202 family)
MKASRFWAMSSIGLCIAAYMFYRAATMAHVRQVSYDTYISVTLTALAVILAAVAILVGAAAIWGYQQISAQAASQAEKAVGERMASLLGEANVKQMIVSHVEREAAQVYRDLQLTTPDISADIRPVADTYPERRDDQ